MRKVLMSFAAAGTALAFATPAAAQYFPGQPYGYGAPYGNALGYGNYGTIRSLQARINNVERQINRLDRRDRIRDRTADRLRNEANRIERRLRLAARNGLNPYEMNDIQRRISRLEQQVNFSLSNRFGRGWNSNNGYYDRDRDGRDDRYEDDHGYRHD